MTTNKTTTTTTTTPVIDKSGLVRIASPNVVEHLEFIVYLARVSVKTRRILVRAASTDVLRAVSEVAANCLYGNIAYSEQDKRRLKNHKAALRVLSLRNTPYQRRREELLSDVGLLKPLLSPFIQQQQQQQQQQDERRRGAE